jgi:hypothetical protein
MGRQSITERFDRLEARGDELARLHAEVSPVHVETLNVLRELLTMGNTMSTNKVPAALRAMMRTLDKLQPMLLEELANVPPESIRDFMREVLLPPIQRIIDTPLEGEAHGVDDDELAADRPGSDLASTA